MNRSQTWAESAEDPLISEGKLFICGTGGIYLSALLAIRHIPRAADPGAGWTCSAVHQIPGSAPPRRTLRSRAVADGAPEAAAAGGARCPGGLGSPAGCGAL